jgi:hypothetical protein
VEILDKTAWSNRGKVETVQTQLKMGKAGINVPYIKGQEQEES